MQTLLDHSRGVANLGPRSGRTIDRDGRNRDQTNRAHQRCCRNGWLSEPAVHLITSPAPARWPSASHPLVTGAGLSGGDGSDRPSDPAVDPRVGRGRWSRPSRTAPVVVACTRSLHSTGHPTSARPTVPARQVHRSGGAPSGRHWLPAPRAHPTDGSDADVSPRRPARYAQPHQIGDIDEQPDLHPVAGFEPQLIKQSATSRGLTSQRLADVSQLGPQQREERSREQLGDPAPAFAAHAGAIVEALDQLHVGISQQGADDADDEGGIELDQVGITPYDEVPRRHCQRSPKNVALPHRRTKLRQDARRVNNLRAGPPRQRSPFRPPIRDPSR